MMRATFVRDLERWEAGSLDVSELEGRYPRAEVGRLTDLWGRLANSAAPQTVDVQASWDALRARLPERTRRPSRTPRQVRRSLVGAFAIMLVGTSIAYAANVKPVRDEVNRIVRSVSHVFTGADQQGPTGDQGPNDDNKGSGSGEKGSGGRQQQGGQSGQVGGTGGSSTSGREGTSGQSGTGNTGDEQGPQGISGSHGANSGAEGRSGG